MADQTKKTATKLADKWVKVWNTNDAPLASSIFSPAGVYYSFVRLFTIGSQIEGHVQLMGYAVNNMERVGKLKTKGDRTFTFVVEADLTDGNFVTKRYRGTQLMKLELDQDKIGLLTWLVDPAPHPPGQA